MTTNTDTTDAMDDHNTEIIRKLKRKVKSDEEDTALEIVDKEYHVESPFAAVEASSTQPNDSEEIRMAREFLDHYSDLFEELYEVAILNEENVTWAWNSGRILHEIDQQTQSKSLTNDFIEILEEVHDDEFSLWKLKNTRSVYGTYHGEELLPPHQTEGTPSTFILLCNRASDDPEQINRILDRMDTDEITQLEAKALGSVNGSHDGPEESKPDIESVAESVNGNSRDGYEDIPRRVTAVKRVYESLGHTAPDDYTAREAIRAAHPAPEQITD